MFLFSPFSFQVHSLNLLASEAKPPLEIYLFAPVLIVKRKMWTYLVTHFKCVAKYDTELPAAKYIGLAALCTVLGIRNNLYKRWVYAGTRRGERCMYNYCSYVGAHLCPHSGQQHLSQQEKKTVHPHTDPLYILYYILLHPISRAQDDWSRRRTKDL